MSEFSHFILRCFNFSVNSALLQNAGENSFHGMTEQSSLATGCLTDCLPPPPHTLGPASAILFAYPLIKECNPSPPP